MTQIRLDRTSIHAIIRHLEPTGVPEHVGVDREPELSLAAQPLDHFLEAINQVGDG